MSEPGQIVFSDAHSYERFMGVWSRLVGEVFLDWLALKDGLRWADVGCGNGAFTDLLMKRCKPKQVSGIDPSPAQIEFAKARMKDDVAEFEIGDAMALPYSDKSFDAAVMALVLFFVPKPDIGLAEMIRVTEPGGTVAAYVWDLFGGGFPAEPVKSELEARNFPYLLPPSAEISRLEPLRKLWIDAGLENVETKVISVERTFRSFDEFWEITRASPTLALVLPQMSAAEIESIAASVRQNMPIAADGSITYASRAHAVKGRVP
jgi:ubiquinone/menaquinone biosynthesis C-methylase UbiE